MVDLNLAQSFSIVALNAQDSLHMTTVKKAALRCMAAGVVLEACLENALIQPGDGPLDADAVDPSQAAPYQQLILKPLLGQTRGGKANLRQWLRKASMLPNKQLLQFEHAVAYSLKEARLLEEIPHLLGCDLYYDSAGVSMMEYRSNMQAYAGITENLRAEILEDGPVTDETVCLLWLLRESGCMHDLFSRNELEKVAVRMYELYQSGSLAKALFPARIRHGVELAVKRFLHIKKAIIKTPLGSGINFVFPFLERSQSVFIDTEAWFSDSKTRLEDVKARLEAKGHGLRVLKDGPVPLIKIDNIVYQGIPQAIYGRVPIHGVRLLPKRPI